MHSLSSLRVLALLVLLFVPALAHAATVTLTWDVGHGTLPTGFLIERSAGQEAFMEIARPDAPPWIDTELPTLLPICYLVKAWSVLGVSKPSNVLCIDQPTVPVNVTISTSGPSAENERVKVRTTVRKIK